MEKLTKQEEEIMLQVWSLKKLHYQKMYCKKLEDPKTSLYYSGFNHETNLKRKGLCNRSSSMD